MASHWVIDGMMSPLGQSDREDIINLETPSPQSARDPLASSSTKKRSRSPEPVPPPKRTRLPRKECIICCSDVPTNQFPKRPHQGSRSHDRSVCFKCWAQHLDTEVDSKPWEKVCCPECSTCLQEREVKALASQTTYEKYLDKAAKACMSKDLEYYTCPASDCSWGHYHNTDDGNIFNCQVCHSSYCTACEVPMHTGETCQVYQDRTRPQRQAEENESSAKVVGEISKPCPSCKARLDKYVGCDHVTCQRCQHEFCWLCFAPYRGLDGIFGTKGNEAHESSCRYYAPPLPRRLVYDSDDDDN